MVQSSLSPAFDKGKIIAFIRKGEKSNHKILVPEALWWEILADGDDDAAKQKLPLLAWAKRISAISFSEEIKNYNLGKGETEAVSLALGTPNAGGVLDDYAAGKCAKDL